MNPTPLDEEMIGCICASIREGCYASVAAGRVGVSPYTFYKWAKRGEREAGEREEHPARPVSIYERFYTALECAKAEARYSAETRVFRTQPLQWLKAGYAKNDWRESDQLVREVADELERRAERHVESLLHDLPAEFAALSPQEQVAALRQRAHWLRAHPEVERTERDREVLARQRAQEVAAWHPRPSDDGGDDMNTPDGQPHASSDGSESRYDGDGRRRATREEVEAGVQALFDLSERTAELRRRASADEQP